MNHKFNLTIHKQSACQLLILNIFYANTKQNKIYTKGKSDLYIQLLLKKMMYSFIILKIKQYMQFDEKKMLTNKIASIYYIS